jgi:hypothetical protein
MKAKSAAISFDVQVRRLSRKDRLETYDAAAGDIVAAWRRILGVSLDRRTVAIHLRQKKKHWQRPTAAVDALIAEIEGGRVQ